MKGYRQKIVDSSNALAIANTEIQALNDHISSLECQLGDKKDLKQKLEKRKASMISHILDASLKMTTVRAEVRAREAEVTRLLGRCSEIEDLYQQMKNSPTF